MANPMIRIFTGMHAKLYQLTGGRMMGGGAVEDGNVLVLHHVGNKSGKTRDTPLQYLVDGESLLLAASFGGNDVHPGWYHNLVASPEVEITINRNRRKVWARETTGDERETRWARFKAADKRFGQYEAKTDRVIPVFVLEQRGDGGASW